MPEPTKFDHMGKLLVVMQAAWIEWRRGRGADAAMQWIDNTLSGPGLIPTKDEPCADDAQAYFDLNRPDRFPSCDICGAPSYSTGGGGSFCREHSEI